MSLWSRIFRKNSATVAPTAAKTMRYAVVDLEVSAADRRIRDIGIVTDNGRTWHKAAPDETRQLLSEAEFVCGHNIVRHDARFLWPDGTAEVCLVDTLCISPILFPEHPYHHLLKDDKLVSEQVNNPVNDCLKARDLLLDELSAWQRLPPERQTVLAALLAGKDDFDGFLRMVGAADEIVTDKTELAELIRSAYDGCICRHADVAGLIATHPVELAYALSLAATTDRRSLTPGWVLHQYPAVEQVLDALCNAPCHRPDCPYCRTNFGLHENLKAFFGYDDFRTYAGEPLQERAARAAVEGDSLLAIFPTGGGKSLTFQLPALMAGRAVHGLTVVISPLQSLMKDQVDNLAERGITDAVFINGLLDPISRAEAFSRVSDGSASLLYIAPESLRSATVERILMHRHVVRFVIDEAHCFSAWGQDFRVDYLHIGPFISRYMQQKGGQCVPVSCFTATAKQKVVQDICDYFRQTIGAELRLFTSSASRTNLHYSVIHTETDADKYARLRALLSCCDCPAIVYVSRTKRTRELAGKLTADGLPALPFNGRMDAAEKVANQEAFMSGGTRIIVATSAFGMGVDKKDVGLVVHYDISDSLENYVQEAGRAGRDPHLEARCFVLYNDDDLNKHFILLNQTKLSLSEIQQVWQAVKHFTRQRPTVCCSALEIARQAGWDDSVSDIETRVRTALSALEQAGYVERGNNVPHVYATGITVRNLDEARRRIEASALFASDEAEQAVRIIRSLISQKYTTRGEDSEAESRIDYLADTLGLGRHEVVSAVERMRQEGILADTMDIAAYLKDSGATPRHAAERLDRFARLEHFLLGRLQGETAVHTTWKQLNDEAVREGIDSSIEKDLRTLVYFLVVKGYARKRAEGVNALTIAGLAPLEHLQCRQSRRTAICRHTIGWLYGLLKEQAAFKPSADGSVRFSVVALLADIQRCGLAVDVGPAEVTLEEVKEALLYLQKIDALKMEGGFLVLYNAMHLRRTKDMRLRYKKDDYRLLDRFYQMKMQQVHIVGEYANLMVRDYDAALRFVHDYFHMDYKAFIDRYFSGRRREQIVHNVTPQKYEQLFGCLSTVQKTVIDDSTTRCIVVAAGPGSGKTRLLVHKLASLLLLEDVKHEQLLMLTFSRAAVTEFKQRLMALIGNAAHFVEIRTFHSYSFELLGRVGNLDEAAGVVRRAADMIANGEVEPNRIAKSVVVLDEAQDMDADDFALVTALMEANPEMRVIAVGDDDQNIYAFRHSDSRYMRSLAERADARLVDMTDNYRSTPAVVRAANALVSRIAHRMKHTPVRAVRSDEGRVEITHHASPMLYAPVLADVMRHHAEGCSASVLTQTNSEAATLVALLRHEGVKARLVQSPDKFCFGNVAEMRHFVKHLRGAVNGAPLIAREAWETAKQHTRSRYGRSTALPLVEACWATFEATARQLYMTDFREFLFESSAEDFQVETAADEVVVSTIHKAKGREFDDVYLFVSDNHRPDANALRCLYVGMTRARRRLFIHSCSPAFVGLPADEERTDAATYALPQEVVLQLTHRDVNLAFVDRCKNDVLALQSGDVLDYFDLRFCSPATGRPVAMLSAAMKATLHGWQQRGYRVSRARVRFIVAWRPKDAARDVPERAVLLPDLVLRLEE